MEREEEGRGEHTHVPHYPQPTHRLTRPCPPPPQTKKWSPGGHAAPYRAMPYLNSLGREPTLGGGAMMAAVVGANKRRYTDLRAAQRRESGARPKRSRVRCASTAELFTPSARDYDLISNAPASVLSVRGRVIHCRYAGTGLDVGRAIRSVCFAVVMAVRVAV